MQITLQKLDEIFGNQENKGKVLFYNVILNECGPVKVKRYDGNNEEEVIYIKIDRLTGGAYDKAMRKQKEIWGKTALECKLDISQHEDKSYIFPLVYVLRRIGKGLVSMGGRTSVGLGEFAGTKLKLSGALNEDIPIDQISCSNQICKMREYYSLFERWCMK